MKIFKLPKVFLLNACRFGVICGVLAAGAAWADTLEAPKGRLERGSVVRFTYRADRPLPKPAKGILTLDWTDVLGREVKQWTMSVRLAGDGSVLVPVDLNWAVATQNTLRGRLKLNGKDSEASADFVVPPPEDGWADWQTIMWANLPPAQLAALPLLGITANKVLGTREKELTAEDAAKAMAPLLAAGLAPYIENIATDFYAPYHRYLPGKPVTWLFDEARRRYRENPADPAVRLREPSLSDPAWQARIDARLAQHARIYGRYRPLFYNLGDETGIADLAANWDFDFSPQSLAGMRVWLRTRYPSLPALNRQWGTAFADWNAVVPPTTEATVARTDGNYSAWSDFKGWMDEAFARALRQGARALRAADPQARAGIEGTQAPGWGGYDFTRLARALDVLEMYDMHNNVEIALALNPALITLTTSFGSGPNEVHRIWHEALLGQRGVAIWDEVNAIVAPDGTPGPRGEQLRGVFSELRGGIAAQLIASRPARDPVAILYSPESFRLDWLLDVKADTKPWTVRDSERESFDTVLRAAMRRSASLLQHAGLQPDWLSPQLLADGALEARGIRLLVLPHVLALSDREAAAIGRFVQRGGVVLADVTPGEYDGHGRQREQPALAGLGGKIRLVEALRRDDAPVEPFDAALRDAGVEPMFSVEAADGTRLRDVEIRQFRNGRVSIVGLQRDLPEKTEPEKAGPGEVQSAFLRLRQPAWRTDLRGRVPGAQASRFPVRLDPAEPTVLALSPAPLPKPVLNGPRQARLGAVVAFDLRLSGRSAAASHVVHLEARDPAGRVVGAYSANIALRGGKARWQLKLALNDKPGIWTVTARDGLGAGEVFWPVEVVR
jgi:hypothetical protein